MIKGRYYNFMVVKSRILKVIRCIQFRKKYIEVYKFEIVYSFPLRVWLFKFLLESVI